MRSHSESAAREAMGRVQMREEVAADRVAIAALAGAVAGCTILRCDRTE